MSRTGRYWLFFVIVAVGLALSWGQVGRKTERVLGDRPVVYLQHEPDCRPRSTPCAAVGRDRALVVGPGGQGLRVETTGFDSRSPVAARGELLAGDGGVLREIRFPVDRGAWYVGEVGPGARRLRVQVRTAEATTVAEFPLTADRRGGQ